LPKKRAAWYVTFVAVCCTCLLLSNAGEAAAEDLGFRDDFAGLDPARWSKGDHMLGRSHLDPANVDVDGQNLRIKLPARTLDGGEISTTGLTGYGSYSARMKLPNAPSSITGFFLYKAPDLESEVDIEVFNDSTRRIMFTTYSGGRQTHTETTRLPFDPTTGFHEYRFDYSQNAVTFFADGVEMRTWDTGIPQTSMHLMVNSWFPSWLEGRRPKKNAYTYVDWISYEAQPPAGSTTQG
jgi:endo-1,3-1,4-beta-glycanase ExoK